MSAVSVVFPSHGWLLWLVVGVLFWGVDTRGLWWWVGGLGWVFLACLWGLWGVVWVSGCWGLWWLGWVRRVVIRWERGIAALGRGGSFQLVAGPAFGFYWLGSCLLAFHLM